MDWIGMGWDGIGEGEDACVVSTSVNATIESMDQLLREWTAQKLCTWFEKANATQPMFSFEDVSRALVLAGDIDGTDDDDSADTRLCPTATRMPANRNLVAELQLRNSGASEPQLGCQRTNGGLFCCLRLLFW